MKRVFLLSLCFTLLLTSVSLTDESGEMDEIIVTATRTEKETKELSGNVSIITSEEIEESNAKNADELMTQESGVDMQGGKFPGLKTTLNMRGLQGQFGAQRVLILIDGRPINEEYLGDVDFRSIPVDNIDRVEIVRGPNSALYGSNAMGGVINFITKQHKDKPFVKLETFTGSYNTYGTIIKHGAKFGKLDYYLTVNDEITDGYLNNSDGSTKDWESENFSGRFNYMLDETSLIMFSLGQNSGLGNEENFIRDMKRNYLDLNYETNWFTRDDKAKFSARVYRNGLLQDLRWKTPSPTAEYSQYTMGTQLQQSLTLIENHFFTFGIDAKTEDALVKETNGTIDQTINSSAVYLQDEITLNENFMLTLGLRYDRHEEFGSEVSPKGGLSYHLNEKTKLRTAISKAYRAPSISDMYLPTTSFFGMTFEGNPNVDPETMWSTEAGIDYKFTEKLLSKLTVYQASLKDAWDYMLDNDGVFRPRNVSKVSSRGIEAEIEYDILENLNGFINYTLTESRYKEDKSNPLIEDNYVEEVPLAKGSLGIRFVPPPGNTIVNLKLKASGKRYTDAANNNPLSKYMVVDIGINTKVNEYSSIFISVNNVFDRAYQEVTDYIQPGRWFTSGFSLKF